LNEPMPTVREYLDLTDLDAKHGRCSSRNRARDSWTNCVPEPIANYVCRGHAHPHALSPSPNGHSFDPMNLATAARTYTSSMPVVHRSHLIPLLGAPTRQPSRARIPR
jgi:hypothetical protein